MKIYEWVMHKKYIGIRMDLRTSSFLRLLKIDLTQLVKGIEDPQECTLFKCLDFVFLLEFYILYQCTCIFILLTYNKVLFCL